MIPFTFLGLQKIGTRPFLKKGKKIFRRHLMIIIILGLVFWDIIYLTELPDAFRDPTQAAPLGRFIV
jgi:hypothetical protein